MITKNRTDRFIKESDLSNELDLEDFNYKDNFSFLCDLIPDKERERLVIENADDTKINRVGVVYLFVLDNKILKVGSSITSFKDRVQSYNCGKQKYRRVSGTCSTTNYHVLQNILRWDKSVKVYAFFPDYVKINIFGEQKEVPSPAKEFEKKILKELKSIGKFPVLCTQQ